MPPLTGERGERDVLIEILKTQQAYQEEARAISANLSETTANLREMRVEMRGIADRQKTQDSTNETKIANLETRHDSLAREVSALKSGHDDLKERVKEEKGEGKSNAALTVSLITALLYLLSYVYTLIHH